MSFRINLLDNLCRLPLKSFINKADYYSGTYPMLLPLPAATLKQMDNSYVSLGSTRDLITDANLLDIHRQDVISIFNQNVSKERFASTENLLNHIRSLLNAKPFKIEQIVKQFIMHDLLSERIKLKNLNWIPTGNDETQSTIKITRENSDKFSIYYANGLSLVDATTLQTQLAGTFELKLNFNVVTGHRIDVLRYFNMPKYRSTVILQLSVTSAQYYFTDPNMIQAANRLGYSPIVGHHPKQTKISRHNSPSHEIWCEARARMK